MNVKIEVVAAEAKADMLALRVIAIVKGFFAEVVFTTQVVTTSILRVLRQGRSSLSAVPGDSILTTNGGEAVAAA